MKQKKSIIAAVLLTTVLAGNTFAADFTGGSLSDFFTSIYNAVTLLISSSPCEGRQCQTCKPTEREGEGNCRPTR